MTFFGISFRHHRHCRVYPPDHRKPGDLMNKIAVLLLVAATILVGCKTGSDLVLPQGESMPSIGCSDCF